jgi:hypothetical protein
MRRHQAQRRRRDVLLALVVGAAGSLLLALIPGLSVMWTVQVVFDLMLLAYVALLVRMRNLALERDAKLMYIRPSEPRPIARSAGRRVAYDFGGPEYDLDFRRAAN